MDKSDMLGVLKKFPALCREALGLNKGLTVSGDITSIVVVGMGGSSIGGQILKMYMKDSKIPVFINRGYDIPAFVDHETLVFAISYSGNTEETLSAVKAAKDKKAQIIAITSGGQLEKEVEKIIKVPPGYQPRAAVPFLFFPMMGVLYNSKIIEVRNSDLNEMMQLLQDSEYYVEEGQRLAKVVKNRVPIIYTSEDFEAVGYRFKTQINENAKFPAFNNVFSEMNHNEINAFQFIERSKFMAFIIRDSKDHPRIKKRFDICSEIMGERVDVEQILTKGKCLLARIFSTIHLCDMASYYIAIEQRVDPTPVEVIEKLKKQLK